MPDRPTWLAISIGIADLLLGIGAAILAFVANATILWFCLVPLAIVFMPIGVLEIVRALRHPENAAFR